MTETFEIARKNMVINQLRPNKINEEKILKIFENIPKENFLDMSLGKNCYLDKNLDITEKRGYLKNLHLAQIIKYSEISPNDKVLHLGGLTGYFSTIISSLSKELLVVEENKELFKLLEQNVKKNNTVNINLSVHLPVPMRSKPSASTVTSGGNWVQAYMGANGNISNASISVGDSGSGCKDLTAFRIYLSSAHSGLSAGQALWVHTIANAKLILSADF